MKILRELLIVFTICLAGQLISEVLPIPLPASVLIFLHSRRGLHH